VGHPERLLLSGLAIWLAAALFMALMRRFGLSRLASLVGAWVATYLFVRGGVIPVVFGYTLGILLVAVALGIGTYLISKAESPRLYFVIVLASLLLVFEFALSFYATWTSLGEDRSRPPPAALDLDLELRPDIVLVIADAYVGLDGLQRYFGSEPKDRSGLLDQGFWLPDLAFSAYTSTDASLPAILDMDYPIVEGPGVNRATRETLYRRIGGENRFVEVLKNNGYEFTMVESGWSGSICGEQVDHCVISPFLDESVHHFLEMTWLGRPVLRRFGYAFTVGALGTMAWLDENIERVTNNSTPDFVLAHLEIPHPPMYLNAQCEFDGSPDRSGVTIYREDVDLDKRKAAYLEQVSCVDKFMADLAERVDSDVVLVLAGDHGSDSQHQLAIHPANWSDDHTRERLNVMFAYRGPDSCRPAEPVFLPAVLRGLLQCMSGEELSTVPQRMFQYAQIEIDGKVSPVVEVDQGLVDALFDDPAVTR
jgi:hypothetical protein